MLLDNVNKDLLLGGIFTDLHTNLVGNAGTFFHEFTGRIMKPRHIIITRPIRVSLEPKRLLLVVCAGTGTQLGLNQRSKYQLADSGGGLGAYLIFPSVVGYGIMGCLSLYLGWEIKECFRNGELGLDF